MPASVSFIIPVLNEQERIAALLQQLRLRFPGSQLVVVDGGSEDDTVRRATPLCNQLLLSPPGRALQMNLGGQVASGDYLFFLHADSLPTVESGQLQHYLEQSPVWGFCRIRLSGERLAFKVIGAAMNIRSRLTCVATGDQMIYLRRELFERCGGFDDIPLMEDVALSKRLRRIAGPLIMAQPVETSSRRWQEGGVCATVCRMWCLRLAYFLGVSPQRLWQHYYGR